MNVDVKRVAEEFLRKKSRGGFALDAAPSWLIWSLVVVGLWCVLLFVGWR